MKSDLIVSGFPSLSCFPFRPAATVSAWTSVIGAPRTFKLGDGCVPVPAACRLGDLNVVVMVVNGEVEACRDRGVVAGILARNLAAWTPRLWVADRGSLLDSGLHT